MLTPFQVLSLVLCHLTTQHLLALAPVSRHFYHHVTTCLYARLSSAAGLESHTLVLSCYHPEAQPSTPDLFCSPLGTPGLEDAALSPLSGRLSTFNSLYSHFKPIPQRLPSPPRHPAGDVPGSRTHPSTRADGERRSAWRTITLDEGQMFGQLCCSTELVRLRPRPGVLMSAELVSNGLVRVFRGWMAKRAVGLDGGSTTDEGVLWVNDGDQRVGIRFGATRWPREDGPTKDLAQDTKEDERAVDYDIEIQGEIRGSDRRRSMTDMVQSYSSRLRSF